MSTIINGTSSAITFPDATVQNTAATNYSAGGNITGNLNVSGNLGVGTTAPSTKLNVFGSSPSIFLEQDSGVAGNTQIRLNAAGGANTASVRLQDKYIWASTASGTSLNIGNDLTTAQMSLDSNGLLANTAITTNPSFVTNNNHASTPYGIGIQFNGAAPNNTTQWVIQFGDSGAYRFRVWSNGNVVNSNNSYGSISDVKLKENIVDATPKLDKLMGVKVRNYNLIGESTKQIGVVAQELEEIFPSMIDVSPDIDKDGNDLGTTSKSVKYSVFVPMLIKAIQELKTEVDALKAAK